MSDKPFGFGAKFYNMTMVKNGNRVLVLDRTKCDWPGLTFPGGKVEKGERFAESAIREIYEETGLTIAACDLVPCGVVHWAHRESGVRYIEFLYKAERFSGFPKMGTEEGSVFWMNEEDLVRSDRLSPNFDLYLPLFLEGNYSELFFEWDGKAWQAEPHYFSYE